jgi:hypothetical protein
MPYSLGNTIATANPGALEIEPGTTVADLKSREECERARFLLETAIDSIMSQINRSEEEIAAGNPPEPGWRTRAQNAIRWKRRTIRAIADHAARLSSPKAGVPEGARRQAILDVVEDYLAPDEFADLVQMAKTQHPELWPSEPGNG